MRKSPDCFGRTSAGWIRGTGTAGTGAGRTKEFERVYPGPVAVAPLNPEPISTHQGNLEWVNIRGNGGRVEQGPSGHLLDAGGAGARQPQVARGIEHRMPGNVPLDEKAVIASVDCVRERNRHSVSG